VALLLGGVIGRRRSIRFDRGLALLALEVVDLIAQALVFGLRGAQVGGQGFDEVQQPNDQLTRTLVGDAAQVKVIEHWAIQVRWLICCPLYPVRAQIGCGTMAACPGLLRRYSLPLLWHDSCHNSGI
jgi:hypothetical protein